MRSPKGGFIGLLIAKVCLNFGQEKSSKATDGVIRDLHLAAVYLDYGLNSLLRLRNARFFHRSTGTPLLPGVAVPFPDALSAQQVKTGKDIVVDLPVRIP